MVYSQMMEKDENKETIIQMKYIFELSSKTRVVLGHQDKSYNFNSQMMEKEEKRETII
jgi:hypothetical protein